ncbi:MAG: ABC transporter substrate-binding protein [Betaproteobacteria bacterium]
MLKTTCQRWIAVAMLACIAIPALAAGPDKVLHLALPDITALDPHQISDLYSARVVNVIFEGLYQYDYLASPAKVVPNTAVALPEITDGGRTWTIRLQKGIRFTDDPAFKGAVRELRATDYVYSIKRSLDPNLRIGGDPAFTNLVLGARAVVDSARKTGKFDYDAPIEGLRAIDAYTLQIRLTDVEYTVLDRLASRSSFAVAREVVEAAGAEIMMHPVGTGPFRLADWRRGSRVVLDANPAYRTITFPDSDDPKLKSLVQAMKGRKLPALSRIEIAIIEEQVPELLAFDQGGLDYINLTGNILSRMVEDNKLKSEYAKRGVTLVRYSLPAMVYTYFNQDDPVIGGNAPERIALRRAIAMAFNTPEFIKVFYGGQGTPANQILPPGVFGHDASLPSRAIYDPAAARALLDRFGYKDRDGDGMRETPEGKPLVLVQSSTPDSDSRESDALWLKSMAAVGLKMSINTKPFGDLLKQSQAGQLMMFNLGFRAGDPAGFDTLATLWSKSPESTNRARFRNPDYDTAYEKFLRTPDPKERTALARRMSEIVNTYVPLTLQVFPIANAFTQPWLLGFYPSQFGFTWKYMDIDLSRKPKT